MHGQEAFFDCITASSTLLIALPKGASTDHIASAFALAHFLEAQGKFVHISGEEISISSKLSFLVQKQILPTPPQSDACDYIFCLDPSTALYTQWNQGSWQNIPKIIFGHSQTHPDIAVYDGSASSLGELLSMLLLSQAPYSLDEPVATALLTAMIAATRNFKDSSIRPETLAHASRLVECGANREHIIRALYHTKSLAMLRLWGKALIRLRYDKDLFLVSTTISHDDFHQSGAEEEDLYEIVNEIIANSPEEKMTLLLHESKKNKQAPLRALLQVGPGFDARDLAQSFRPRGSRAQVQFFLDDDNLQEAQEKVVEMIQKELKG